MTAPVTMCACRRFGPPHAWEPGESCPPVRVEPCPHGARTHGSCGICSGHDG